jgi:hypothetical protein
MKRKTLLSSTFLVALFAVLISVQSVSAADVPVGAAVNANVDASVDVKTSLKNGTDRADLRASAKTEAKEQSNTKMVTNLVTRGDKEIDARVDSLNKLITRISDMKRLTDAQKQALTVKVQTLITTITQLKAKIDAEGSAAGASGAASSTLRVDTASITQAYRVYALYMPQMSILATIDRLGSLSNAYGTVAGKIQARISQAQAAGKDVTALQKTFADYNAKISDIGVQGVAALNIILPLVPDNGDKTVMASNKAALMSARADIKKASDEAMAARKDLDILVKGVAVFKLGPITTTTNTGAVASTTAQ